MLKTQAAAKALDVDFRKAEEQLGAVARAAGLSIPLPSGPWPAR
jgi:hypothetical protein